MIENKLKTEKSIYLLQHANNPVAWQTWSKKTLELAQAEDKPIFLSSGYSSCHWCHVMAAESFLDEATAKILNEKFIPIKLDREEYPEIDKKFQLYLQTTAKQGGWPLSVFLTPDGEPFFGGTYFPKESKYNLPAFSELLIKISELYQNDHAQVDTVIGNYNKFLRNFYEEQYGYDQYLSVDRVQTLKRPFTSTFDVKNGGFGESSKFPHIPTMMYLTKYYAEDELINRFLTKTADKLCLSSIHDHIFGGFFRYTVDQEWKVPHFEKMLYDNALIPLFLTEMYDLSGNTLYLNCARKALDFVLNSLNTEFGVVSSVSADSRNKEGKISEGHFYRIFEDDLKYLTEDLKKLFDEKIYSHQGVMYLFNTDAEEYAKLEPVFGAIEKAVLENKEQPPVDTKILLSQNALFCKALLRFSEISGQDFYYEQAVSLLNKLRHFLFIETDLFRINYNGEAFNHTTLEEYAYVSDLYLDFFEITKEKSFLEFASKLIKKAMELFYEDGKFYLDMDRTIIDSFDESMPSAFGLIFNAICKYGSAIDIKPENKMLNYVSDRVLKYPGGHSSMIEGLDSL